MSSIPSQEGCSSCMCTFLDSFPFFALSCGRITSALKISTIVTQNMYDFLFFTDFDSIKHIQYFSFFHGSNKF